MSLRPATADDLAWAADLSRRLDLALVGADETDPDDLADLLARHAGVVCEPQRGLALAMSPHGETALLVEPGDAEAWDELLRWLAGQGSRLSDARDNDAERLAALARHGWVRDHVAMELHREVGELPARAWPDGVELQTVDEVGTARAHEAVYDVWLDVPGHLHRERADWAAIFLDPPGSEPAHQLVALLDGRVVGVCLTRVFSDGVGWVSQLATRDPGRGIGLGRALLIEACHRLLAQGATALGLSVNGANTDAAALYESLGYARTTTWVIHRLP